MRKIVLIMIIGALLFPGIILGAPKPNIILMGGIHEKFGDLRNNKNIKNTTLESLTAQVNFLRQNYGSLKNQVVIGHSQGGVRALGYAHSFGSNSAGNIAAAITIGSPVRGHSALLKGTRLSYEIDRMLKTIRDGLTAAAPGLPRALNIIDSSINLKALAPVAALFNEPTLQLLAEVGKGGSRAYGIQDLHPNSAFITNNIIPKADKGYWRNVFSGRYGWRWIRRYRRIRLWWGKVISVPYMKLERYRIYRRVWITRWVATAPRIASNIDVGMIVGGCNDQMAMLASADAAIQTKRVGIPARKSDSEYKKAYNTIQNVISIYVKATEVIEAFYSSKVFQNPVLGGLANTQIGYARAGKNAVRNYKTTFGTILGSMSSDSFIPTKDQYMRVNELGGRPIVRDYIVTVNSADHQSEKNASEIWGQNGSLVTRVKDKWGFFKDVIQTSNAIDMKDARTNPSAILPLWMREKGWDETAPDRKAVYYNGLQSR